MHDVCLIVESDGRLLTAGIPAYAYDLMSAMENVRFAVVTIAHRPFAINSFVAKLPPHVHTVVNVCIEEEFLPKVKSPLRKKRKRLWEQITALYDAPLEEKTRYCEEVLLGLAQDEARGLSYEDVARSEEFWRLLCRQYERYCRDVPFMDYVWIFRQTQLPFFQLMQMELPLAKVYHVFSSRYAGCAGLVAKIRHRSHLIFDVREDFFIDRTGISASAHGAYPGAATKGMHPRTIEAYYKTYNATLKTIQHLTCFYADTIITPGRSGDLPVFNKEFEYKYLVIPAGSERLTSPTEKTAVKEPFTIGLVSDITPESDVKSFIRACRILFDEKRNVNFRILASGNIHRPYLEECNELKSQLGLEMDVGFYYQHDIIPLLPDLDLVVFDGEESEERKRVVFHALKGGTPMIALNRGMYALIVSGHSDDDRSLGECGMCVESGSPQELARAMHAMTGDKKLAREMGKIAQRRFEQFYSHSIHINSYASMYRNYI